LNENTQRILDKFLNGGNLPLDLVDNDEINDDNEEIRPTVRTMHSKYEINESESVIKLSLKNKIMIAGYIIIALSLLLAIVLTSISMSESSIEYNKLNEQYNALSNDIAELQTQITSISNGYKEEDFIEAGFKTPTENNISYYSSPSLRNSQMYSVETNWFDSLCDFLSGLFGD
jgi:hypothetical protein